jgi:hypothetical protein
VGVKFFNYLIKYLIIAEKIKFVQIIKYIYYFLSAFNVMLGLIIITNFSDFASPELINFFITSLEFLIPVIILEGLSEYMIDLGLFFKNIFRKFIDWVYDREEIVKDGENLSKKDNKSPKIPTQDQFSYKASDLELGEFGDLSTFRGEENHYLNWISIAILIFAVFGISYTLHPELFHSIYSNLKDLFFPGRGGGDSIGGVNTPRINPNLVLKNTTDRIVNDNNLTDLEKANRVNALAKTVLSQVETITPQDKLEKVGILAEAIRIIDDANDTISLASSSPSTSVGSLTPTNIPIILPSNSPSISTSSLTPTNNTIPLPSNSSNLNLQIPASQAADLINLEHSPIIERIPNDLKWAKGGKLKGMFSNNSSSATTPIIENSTPIPIPAKAAPSSNSGDLGKMMEEFNKK